MAPHVSVPSVSTKQGAPPVRRSKLPPVNERQHHPIQDQPGTSRNEDVSSHRAGPNGAPHHDEPPRDSVRGDLPDPNLNHRDHQPAERIENNTHRRRGYGPADPRRKWGQCKNLPVRPDYQRPWRNTAPMRLVWRKVGFRYECCECDDGRTIDREGKCPICLHVRCTECSGSRMECVEKVLEKGKKGGKRGRD
jgi:hypothetical protein